VIDIVDQLNRIHRAVGAGELAGVSGRTVTVRRTYPAPVEDVWDACTNAERIGRWLMPVTGDLRLGGRYQLQGNAGGEIVACEPPHRLRVTWVAGEGAPSEVEVRLAPGTDGDTLFELFHIASVPPEMWDRYGPGAVGVGWDMALLGLGLHLSGNMIDDPAAWQVSPEAVAYVTGSSRAWGEALGASGADPNHVDAAVANTAAFYTGTAPADGAK
jgi:uncharacterized protein YndB with AHSA1/START domain